MAWNTSVFAKTVPSLAVPKTTVSSAPTTSAPVVSTPKVSTPTVSTPKSGVDIKNYSGPVVSTPSSTANPTMFSSQPSLNEQLSYLQNKLNYINGALTPEQSQFNQGYRATYGVNETNPTQDELIKNIYDLNQKINTQQTNPDDMVQDIYGPKLTREDIQKMIQDSMQNDINTKYEADKQASIVKLQQLMNTLNTQKQAIAPQYDLALNDLEQNLNDQSYQARENLNRTGGTSATGLEADLMNKLKAAAIRSRSDLQAKKTADLNAIDTNMANASVDNANQLALLASQKANEMSGIGNKALLNSLSTYSDLIGNANQIQNTRFNQQQTLKNNQRQANMDSIDMRVKQAQLENEQLQRQINEVEANVKLNPAYKQSLLDDLKFKKNENDKKLKLMDAQIKAENALANQRNTTQTNPPTKDEIYAQTFTKLSSLPVNDAVKALTDKTVQAQLMASGIDISKLWDDVLASAIKANQAKDYKTYYAY